VQNTFKHALASAMPKTSAQLANLAASQLSILSSQMLMEPLFNRLVNAMTPLSTAAVTLVRGTILVLINAVLSMVFKASICLAHVARMITVGVPKLEPSKHL